MRKLIDENRKNSSRELGLYVNQTMKDDWYDSVAVGWAIHLKRWMHILVLLEEGADPYKKFEGHPDQMDHALDTYKEYFLRT